ncbi:hypothetical protein [Paracoccus litorisediminis]|uniref:Uncharacterized protein n=1 Tax=Paracoccus litorisediminis TaxID=2006130 RepID=A0A844HS26_9RHOB|nr:hypothetical protein [Paracoccus litorisediminis]MTH61878.1 hypothetical protein [Paracoccus litorisediminis]
MLLVVFGVLHRFSCSRRKALSRINRQKAEMFAKNFEIRMPGTFWRDARFAPSRNRT